MKEWKKEKTSKIADKKTKYEHILNLPVAGTDEADTITYDYTVKNYSRLCQGVVWRFNKIYAPKKWRFAVTDNKTKIKIQRIK